MFEQREKFSEYYHTFLQRRLSTRARPPRIIVNTNDVNAAEIINTEINANNFQDQIHVDPPSHTNQMSGENRMNRNSGPQVGPRILVESTVADPIQNVVNPHENSFLDLNANQNVNLNVRSLAEPFDSGAIPFNVAAPPFNPTGATNRNDQQVFGDGNANATMNPNDYARLSQQFQRMADTLVTPIDFDNFSNANESLTTQNNMVHSQPRSINNQPQSSQNPINRPTEHSVQRVNENLIPPPNMDRLNLAQTPSHTDAHDVHTNAHRTNIDGNGFNLEHFLRHILINDTNRGQPHTNRLATENRVNQPNVDANILRNENLNRAKIRTNPNLNVGTNRSVRPNSYPEFIPRREKSESSE